MKNIYNSSNYSQNSKIPLFREIITSRGQERFSTLLTGINALCGSPQLVISSTALSIWCKISHRKIDFSKSLGYACCCTPAFHNLTHNEILNPASCSICQWKTSRKIDGENLQITCHLLAAQHVQGVGEGLATVVPEKPCSCRDIVIYLLSLVPGSGRHERYQNNIRKVQEDVSMIHNAGLRISILHGSYFIQKDSNEELRTTLKTENRNKRQLLMVLCHNPCYPKTILWGRKLKNPIQQLHKTEK